MEISQLRPAYLQSDSEVLVTLDTVEAALNTLGSYRLELLGEVESRGLAKELDARNTIELLELRHRRDPANTRSDLKFLKNLPNYQAVTAALAVVVAGEDPTGLTPDHAKVIVTTLEKAPSTVPAETLRVAEEQMIEAARHITPSGLRDFGRQVLDRLDTDGPEPAEEEAYRNEKLWIRPVDHGVKFGGYLAGANAELFKTAIHDLAKPHRTVDGELDPRSHEKRQADALTTILDIATGADPTTGVPGVPHLTVTIDFTDLKALTSAAVGELVFGDNISASAVRLLACDAAVLPIVLGTDSQPLDVGMEYRFVTRYIRRALNRRDKGCVICKAPPSHCHAHHVVHWIDGGPTSIQNLVLLCGAHHRAVHAGHWSVTVTAGVVRITRPDWTIPTPANPNPWLTQLPLNTTNLNTTDPRAAHAPSASAKAWMATASSTGSAPARSAGSTTPHPDRPRSPHTATAFSPAAASVMSPAAAGLSWLTPEYAASLNPWGESGTPSAGP
ncbi:HNH endonuclease [Kribbella sp. NBC_00382]|uniref:HNH endonuclease signature motif containing protein n=1 Tax=Kribbella sp. NBC_00382 TaxID=2975967 RepID=UPI002E213CDB